ncbi:MAG: universal stress protein [Bacteroidales bacterium]|jgi:nucleotide-binding universal stress UspA family protein|nr:universal stress protein [Bacteroidales bacterium]
MKNIIVGIDFSENSINAMRHATAIALKNNANLHLVWVKTPGVAKGLVKNNESEFIKKANEQLRNFIKICKSEAINSEVQSVILEGIPYLEIPKYAANLKDSTIVIGTHGVSGFVETFAGSNAFKIVTASKVPVLVLRENIKINRDLIEILVPIDDSFETLQKVRLAIDFAKIFSAKICLAGFSTKGNKQEKYIVSIQLNHAEAMCQEANVRYCTVKQDFKGFIANAIVSFASEKDVNLMCIMRETDSDEVWLKSTTQQLLNSSPMPLVIFPNQKTLSVSK